MHAHTDSAAEKYRFHGKCNHHGADSETESQSSTGPGTVDEKG